MSDPTTDLINYQNPNNNDDNSNLSNIDSFRQYPPHASLLPVDYNCAYTAQTVANERTRFTLLRGASTIPLRFESHTAANNPYINDDNVDSDGNISRNGITQKQLNMRRKAEILQYNKNSSVNNKLTRAQKYAQLVRGTYRRTQTEVIQTPILNASGQIINYDTTTNIYSMGPCESDKSIVTPSSSSDVPGPVVNLSLNKDIPLYKYSQFTNPARIQDDENFVPWTFETIENIYPNISDTNNENALTSVINNSSDHTRLLTLAIGHVDNDFMFYTFTTPIGLFIQGETLLQTANGNVSQTIKLNAMSMNIIYAGRPIVAVYDNISINGTAITDLNNTNNLDLSLNYDINNEDASGGFYVAKFVGNMTVHNLRIPTQYGFIYDIKFKFFVNTNQLSGITYDNDVTTAGVVMNMNSTDTFENGALLTGSYFSDLESFTITNTF